MYLFLDVIDTVLSAGRDSLVLDLLPLCLKRRLVIAVDDIANGATGVVVLKGRFTVPKGSTAAIARGAALKLGTAGNTVVAATAGTTVNNFLCARPVVASTTAMTTVEIVIGI